MVWVDEIPCGAFRPIFKGELLVSGSVTSMKLPSLYNPKSMIASVCLNHPFDVKMKKYIETTIWNLDWEWLLSEQLGYSI